MGLFSEGRGGGGLYTVVVAAYFQRFTVCAMNVFVVNTCISIGHHVLMDRKNTDVNFVMDDMMFASTIKKDKERFSNKYVITTGWIFSFLKCGGFGRFKSNILATA